MSDYAWDGILSVAIMARAYLLLRLVHNRYGGHSLETRLIASMNSVRVDDAWYTFKVPIHSVYTYNLA